MRKNKLRAPGNAPRTSGSGGESNSNSQSKSRSTLRLFFIGCALGCAASVIGLQLRLLAPIFFELENAQNPPQFVTETSGANGQHTPATSISAAPHRTTKGQLQCFEKEHDRRHHHESDHDDEAEGPVFVSGGAVGSRGSVSMPLMLPTSSCHGDEMRGEISERENDDVNNEDQGQADAEKPEKQQKHHQQQSEYHHRNNRNGRRKQGEGKNDKDGRKHHQRYHRTHRWPALHVLTVQSRPSPQFCRLLQTAAMSFLFTGGGDGNEEAAEGGKNDERRTSDDRSDRTDGKKKNDNNENEFVFHVLGWDVPYSHTTRLQWILEWLTYQSSSAVAAPSPKASTSTSTDTDTTSTSFTSAGSATTNNNTDVVQPWDVLFFLDGSDTCFTGAMGTDDIVRRFITMGYGNADDVGGRGHRSQDGSGYNVEADARDDDAYDGDIDAVDDGPRNQTRGRGTAATAADTSNKANVRNDYFRLQRTRPMIYNAEGNCYHQQLFTGSWGARKARCILSYAKYASTTTSSRPVDSSVHSPSSPKRRSEKEEEKEEEERIDSVDDRDEDGGDGTKRRRKNKIDYQKMYLNAGAWLGYGWAVRKLLAPLVSDVLKLPLPPRPFQLQQQLSRRRPRDFSNNDDDGTEITTDTFFPLSHRITFSAPASISADAAAASSKKKNIAPDGKSWWCDQSLLGGVYLSQQQQQQHQQTQQQQREQEKAVRMTLDTSADFVLTSYNTDPDLELCPVTLTVTESSSSALSSSSSSSPSSSALSSPSSSALSSFSSSGSNLIEVILDEGRRKELSRQSGELKQNRMSDDALMSTESDKSFSSLSLDLPLRPCGGGRGKDTRSLLVFHSTSTSSSTSTSVSNSSNTGGIEKKCEEQQRARSKGEEEHYFRSLKDALSTARLPALLHFNGKSPGRELIKRAVWWRLIHGQGSDDQLRQRVVRRLKRALKRLKVRLYRSGTSTADYRSSFSEEIKTGADDMKPHRSAPFVETKFAWEICGGSAFYEKFPDA